MTLDHVDHHPWQQAKPHPCRDRSGAQHHEHACLRGPVNPDLRALLGASDSRL
jgi:hypothetical protein